MDPMSGRSLCKKSRIITETTLTPFFLESEPYVSPSLMSSASILHELRGFRLGQGAFSFKKSTIVDDCELFFAGSLVSIQLSAQRPLHRETSMGCSTSQIRPLRSQSNQTVYKVNSLFCHRLIVVDGVILYVSSITSGNFFGFRLWLPSGIESIASKCFSCIQQLKSVVIETGSRLSRIELLSFMKSNLEFVFIPGSVEVLRDGCFWYCRSLSSVTFESESRL
jgi:hypothetical protein